jgi:hypothetical protein
MVKRNIKQIKSIAVTGFVLVMVSVYLLFSVGIIKATHFCMGREASVTFFSAESRKCACSLYAKEKNSCCDDEQDLIRLEDEQKVLSKFSIPVPVWKLERLYTEQLIAWLTIRPQTFPQGQNTSLPPKIPLWKFHCSYVFYDDSLIA